MKTIDNRPLLLAILNQAVEKSATLSLKLRNIATLVTGRIEWVEDGTLEKISIEIAPRNFKPVRISDIQMFTSSIQLAHDDGISFTFEIKIRTTVL